MSEVMTRAIIGMPFDMAMGDELSRLQFHGRAHALLADYARLEQECERLRAIIDSALEQFPFNADRQKFTFNGQEVTADGDDLFYSVKRVNLFLCEVHDVLSLKP